jgi:hypothetical protein
MDTGKIGGGSIYPRIVSSETPFFSCLLDSSFILATHLITERDCRIAVSSYRWKSLRQFLQVRKDMWKGRFKRPMSLRVMVPKSYHSTIDDAIKERKAGCECDIASRKRNRRTAAGGYVPRAMARVTERTKGRLSTYASLQ